MLQDYMVYTRGSKDDYDRLASVTGDNGFNWSNMNTYFKKVPINLVALLAGAFFPLLTHSIILPCIASDLRAARKLYRRERRKRL